MTKLIALLTSIVLSLFAGVPAFADTSGIEELRGFSQQNIRDFEMLAQRRARADDQSITCVLRLLSIGDLDDLPGISDAVIAQVKLNPVFLGRTSDMKSLARAAKIYTATAEPVSDGKFFRTIQASRPELMKLASRALRGDAEALSRLSGIGNRLASSRLMVQINFTYESLLDFFSDDSLDPRKNDPEIANARFVAHSLSLREATWRTTYISEESKPRATTPEAEFENNMVALHGLATRNNDAKDSRLYWLMDLIFLPDVAELPAILNFAADRIRSDPMDKATISTLASDAQALAEAVRADPDGAAPLLSIQSRRFELATKGAAASRGDRLALKELNDLGQLAMSKPVGRRAFEFFYAYHNKAEFEDRASRRSMNAGRAAAALKTGVFTLASAQREVEMFERDIATTLLPGAAGGLACGVQTKQAKQEWEDRYCRRVPDGKDAAGRPIYELDCGGMRFAPPACVTR